MFITNYLSVPLLTGIFLVGIVIYALINAFKSPLRGLPGPWYTHFTHLVLKWQILTGNRVHYIHSLHQRYGPVVRVSPAEVDVSDLEAFSKIHKIGSGFLKSAWYDGITPNREPGIFVMRDLHQHAARRRLFARAFSVSSLLTNWESDIRQKTELAVKNIKQKAQSTGADVFKWWTLMATDVIAHLSFGESFRMLELGKQTPYIDAIQSSLLMSALRAELSWIYPLLKRLPFQGLKRLLNADSIVFEHGSIAVRNMQSAGDGLSKANLFSQMLAESGSQEKTSLSTSSVQAEASNLIVAGSDTTAVTLTYLIWAVLKQPQLQAELEREISELSDELTFDELKGAPLLNSVIEETLRLYGAAPGALPRVVPGKGLDVCGHYIPPGTVVSTQAFTLHRNENIFEDAERFNGHRFTDKSTLTAAQKAAFSPFGAGSRICIGLHLAWMELRLGAALFFRECRGATLSPEMTDEMMEMENRFLIAPKGHKCIARFSLASPCKPASTTTVLAATTTTAVEASTTSAISEDSTTTAAGDSTIVTLSEGTTTTALSDLSTTLTLSEGSTTTALGEESTALTEDTTTTAITAEPTTTTFEGTTTTDAETTTTTEALEGTQLSAVFADNTVKDTYLDQWGSTFSVPQEGGPTSKARFQLEPETNRLFTYLVDGTKGYLYTVIPGGPNNAFQFDTPDNIAVFPDDYHYVKCIPDAENVLSCASEYGPTPIVWYWKESVSRFYGNIDPAYHNNPIVHFKLE
ncbi:cytochrome p450 3a17 [Fusarium napiforme]|uniref:Cytochrome p450 3a17 n=1 Tax=Fusarium napiforme TaxID=42672 RepID=A0A8H5JCV2_9HYPO|nr:cytochrome p450 3a17 [Fusarium napiforme]